MLKNILRLCLVLMLLGVTRSYGQIPISDTLRYADKLPHWAGAYQLTAPDYLLAQRNQFKSNTFIETYVESVIDHPAWMFTLLNQFTAVRNTELRNTPNIVFNIRFRPVNDDFTAYNVFLTVTGSPEIRLNFNSITQSANFLELNGKTFPTPQDAHDEIARAINEAMRLVTNGVGRSLSPDLLVKFKNEMFWNGHVIMIGKDGDNQVTLQPLAKYGRPLSAEQVRWTNATNGVVNMAGLQSQSVTLTRTDTAANLTVIVKRRTSTLLDIKSILQPIVLSVVQEELTKMLDMLVNMRVDSAANSDALSDLVAKLEAENVILEPTGNLVPLFAEPITLSDSSAFEQNVETTKARALREVKKRKRLNAVLRTKVNVAAFLDILIRQPDKLDQLMDDLILNSGTLLGELVLNLGDPNVMQTSRNIILTYLNRNLVNVSGSYFGQAPDEPITVKVVPSSTAQRFDPAKRLYINNNVDFPGKEEFKTEMTAYLNTLTPPLYVFVNYSQDVSTQTYLARAPGARPAILPEGARFITLSLVNIPGSVKYQIFSSSSAAVQGSTVKDILSGIIKSDAPPSDDFQTYITNKLQALQAAANGLKYFTIIHCDVCEGAGNYSSTQTNFSNVLDVPEQFKYENVPSIPAARLVKIQFAQRNNGKCVVLYYQTSSSETLSVSGGIEGTIPDLISKRLVFIGGSGAYNCTTELGSWSNSICSLTESTIFSNTEATTLYYDNLFQSIAGCLQLRGANTLTEIQIQNLLTGMKSQARTTQEFEFSQGGKVYNLNAQQQLAVNSSPMSIQDMNAGNWSDANVDIKARLAIDQNGILQFESLGIRKNLQLASGKTARLTEIAQNMRTRNNAFFIKYQVKSVNQNARGDNKQLDSEAFPDGKKVDIDENASYFKIICEVSGIGISFLKTSQIEQPVYLYEESPTSVIKGPPIVTGTLESVGMVVTDLTSTAFMVHDLVTDEEARKSAKDGFIAIKDKIADDPSALFPILGEVVLEEFTGSSSEQYTEMNDGNTNEGRREHLITRTSVRTVSSIFASSSFISRLPEMATTIAAKMAKAKAMLKFKNVGDVKDIAETLIKNFEAKVKALGDDATKFLEDFKDASDDLIERFLKKPELVEVWDELNDGGVDVAFRKKPEILEKSYELKCR